MELKEKKYSKRLCIVTGIHGNEAFLFEPLKKYLEGMETGQVEVVLMLANTEAAEKKVRYLEHDLNRSFGAQLNHTPETRIAAEITNKCSDADLVFDLHSHSGKETFSLVNEENGTRLKTLIDLLSADPCIVISPEVTGGTSLIENVANSLSIETGEHDSGKAIAFAKECIKKAISFLNQDSANTTLTARFLRAKRFLKNMSETEIIISSEINNFVKIAKGTEIYPGFSAEEDCIPALVSYTVKPGKKIFLICDEIIKGGVGNE